MAYSDKVVEHFKNPRNVGTLDKSKKNVGTGLVGAPECFVGETLISTPENNGQISLKEAFEAQKPLIVWSYNLQTKKFELKKAICIYKGKQNVIRLKMDDGGEIIATPDHQFLTLRHQYQECQNLVGTSLQAFNKKLGKNGIWKVTNFAVTTENEALVAAANALYIANQKLTAEIWTEHAKIHNLPQNVTGRFASFNEFKAQAMSYNHKIVAIEDAGIQEDVYTLMVEENNNYVIVTQNTLNKQSGVVVKNCGDVMRLQIEVGDDGMIKDAKFKTFGCLASNNMIATPKGYVPIHTLQAGDKVWAWNGTEIVENTVTKNVKTHVPYTQLVKMDFGLKHKIVCTADHVWWSADNRPIEAHELSAGMELLCATKNEFSSLNNIGKADWMRELASETMKQTNASSNIHATLPQNQKGYQHGVEFKEKIAAASKRNWESAEYVENWQKGMAGASEKRPTGLEKQFIELFEENNVDARYVGNSEFWVNTSDGSRLNPDFKVNQQRKLIEVFDAKMPSFMMNRATDGWMIERKQKFAEKGFDVMFIDVKNLKDCLPDVQRFIHNGIELQSSHAITDKRDLRGLERDGDNVAVYDLQLKEGANIFFVQRVMSHNCGSAIASSSLATEWLKGKSIDEALKIDNMDIVEELALPPVKIHCSVLAEDAIKSAIRDYQQKNGIFVEATEVKGH
jgi:NifU-like protein involved in Fe-S cluster formation